MVTKSPMVRVRSETETAKTLPSVSPKRIGIERPPTSTVSSMATPVLLMRTVTVPPPVIGPKSPSNDPEVIPARPAGVIRKAPSPSVIESPSTVAVKSAIARAVMVSSVTVEDCEMLKSPLTSIPEIWTTRSSIDTRKKVPAGRSRSTVVVPPGTGTMNESTTGAR